MSGECDNCGEHAVDCQCNKAPPISQEAREPWARPNCGVCGGWGFIFAITRDGKEKVRVDCGGCREADTAPAPLSGDAAMSNNQNANHPDSGNYITGATLIEALLAEHHYFKGTDYQGLPETLKAAVDRIAELERQATTYLSMLTTAVHAVGGEIRIGLSDVASLPNITLERTSDPRDGSVLLRTHQSANGVES